MAETYFATFQLGERAGAAPSADEVIEVARRWLLKERKGVDTTAMSSVDFLRTGDHSLGDGRLSIRRHFDQGEDVFGVQLSHPGADDPTVEWTSEVLMARTDAVRVAVKTLVRRKGSVVAPLNLQPSRPRVVVDLIQKFGASDGSLKLLAKPVHCSTGDFDSYFDRCLRDVDRTVPVVTISVDEHGKHLVNDSTVADQLAGLAIVCTFENKFVSWRLTDLVGREWSCWGGAIRVYWPGLALDGRPFGHTLLTPRRIEELGGSKNVATALLGIVSRAATGRAVTGLARWSEIERRIANKQLEHALTEARDRGDEAELARLLSADNDELRIRIADLEKEAREARAEAGRAKEEAAIWRKEYEASRRSASDVGVESVLPTPSSVSEALDYAVELFPDRLAVQLNGASDRMSEFEDVESFFRALKFLAMTYCDARRGVRICPDLDAACRNEAGFFYKGGQSDVTVGQYRSEYETVWKGKKVLVEEHIGKGASRDKRFSIRVGIYFDRDDRKVVVGYVGQHQTNRSS